MLPTLLLLALGYIVSGNNELSGSSSKDFFKMRRHVFKDRRSRSVPYSVGTGGQYPPQAPGGYSGYGPTAVDQSSYYQQFPSSPAGVSYDPQQPQGYGPPPGGPSPYQQIPQPGPSPYGQAAAGPSPYGQAGGQYFQGSDPYSQVSIASQPQYGGVYQQSQHFGAAMYQGAPAPQQIAAGGPGQYQGYAGGYSSFPTSGAYPSGQAGGYVGMDAGGGGYYGGAADQNAAYLTAAMNSGGYQSRIPREAYGAGAGGYSSYGVQYGAGQNFGGGQQYGSGQQFAGANPAAGGYGGGMYGGGTQSGAIYGGGAQAGGMYGGGAPAQAGGYGRPGFPGRSRSPTPSVQSLATKLNKLGADTVMDALLQQVQRLHAVAYSREDCPECKTVQHLLEKVYRVPTSVFYLDNLEKGPELLQFIGDITGSTDVPKVFVCGYYIGGYEEVMRSHKKGELENYIRKCYNVKSSKNKVTKKKSKTN